MVECFRHPVSREAASPSPGGHSDNDTSILGWGTHLGDLEVKGLWSPEERLLQINIFELQVIHLSLKVFLPSLRGQSVQV